MMAGDDIDEVRPGDPVARVMVWPVAEVDTRTSLGDAAEELAAEEVGAVVVMSGAGLRACCPNATWSPTWPWAPTCPISRRET